MTSLLVLGGARSGKSRHAEQWLEALPPGRHGRLAYIATAQVLDDEMAARIAHHRARRNARWHTIEAPIALAEAIGEAAQGADGVLVDCLTLWLTNLILAEADIAAASAALAAALAAAPVPVALVANEVGLGIVPDNALARRFRDEAGWLNQKLAATASQVVFVAAGLPMVLK
ncbi:MAG TPA: bifunctional adenosylcobinamide kinase/adenosylcobinamide-phosphate guanylyltransferase [Novosphingobium sp.]|nr:bifunctional adenosylcobinamide kinase/adenosylcobinamide-phosphate guanylyltransferase [Novosphingobium sp.]HZV11102.1 bifunctional adenosylcobinamide kinase/adenosylcobinamide-phosphate guanylyltransferase [Novosphingobium sp.]